MLRDQTPLLPLGASARVLLICSGFIILVAGMKAAAPILNPFLLSCLIAILCAPLVNGLVKWRAPVWLAILLVMAVFFLVGALVGGLITSSVEEFSRQIPFYRARLLTESSILIEWFSGLGISISKETLAQALDPGDAMQFAANTLQGIGGLLTNAFLITLTVVFMLLEMQSFHRKARHAFDDGGFSIDQFNHFASSVNRYLAIKTVISLVTGFLVSIFLLILHVDFPVLWGVLAFLLNYVPNIGSILAGIPAVLLAFVQHGNLTALLAIGGYIVVNVIMGNLIEPRFMGKGLGLSTLVVFLSLIFWGWVLGPVGMLLSIPLTMIVKIALEANKDTLWIAVLLGDGTELARNVKQDDWPDVIPDNRQS